MRPVEQPAHPDAQNSQNFAHTSSKILTEPKQYDFAMEWSDLRIAEVLAENLRALRERHDFSSNRALYLSMLEWSRTKPHIEPVTTNTLRNIEKKQNSPQVDTLNVIAEFYGIPAYMLLIDGMRPDDPFLQSLDQVVRAFVSGDDKARDAMKAMADAFGQRSAA